MMNTRKVGFLRMAAFAACILFAACGPKAAEQGGTETEPDSSAAAQSEKTSSDGAQSGKTQTGEAEENNPIVAITMQDGGVITLELDRTAAPVTVDNFVKLAGEGFYDGTTFHRIMDGFMIQGGDPDGNGSGGPGYQIKGEFSSNGWDNPLSHTRGTISMARGGDPDSAGSQFFITNADATFLDGDYAAFGKVVDGMDVVDDITSVEKTTNARGELSVPLEPVVIETIRVVEG